MIFGHSYFFFAADFIPQEGNGYCRTYSLPYGWKKIGYQRQEGESKNRWDFYVTSPCGRRFRSNPEIARYLYQNPEVKCDLNVTNISYPENLGLNWHLQNTSGLPLMKSGKLPLPPDISGDLL